MADLLSRRHLKSALLARLPGSRAARARRVAKRRLGWLDYGGWSQTALAPGVHHFHCRSVLGLVGFVAFRPLPAPLEEALEEAGLFQALPEGEAWVEDGGAWLSLLYRACPELAERTPRRQLAFQEAQWGEAEVEQALAADERLGRFSALLDEALHEQREREGALLSALANPRGPRSRPSAVAEDR